jgi:hypothetical protein
VATVRHSDSVLTLTAGELPAELTIHVLRPLMDGRAHG